MPRTARTAQTIGVIGIAEISEKNMNALLDDYLEDKKAHFVIPVTNAHFSATVEMLVEYLIKEELPFTAVTDGKAGRGIKSYLADAAETVTATDVGVAIVNAVKGGENGILFSLWDDSQDDELDVAGALEFAEENKVPVLDFCDGLVPVKFVDDESDEPVATTAAADEPPFDPDPPKAERAKAKKAEGVIVDEDAPDDELAIPDYVVGKELGVRKLKRIAKNMGLVNARTVGPLSREEVLDLLYPVGAEEPEIEEMLADYKPPFESDNVTTVAAKGGGTGATKGGDTNLTITAGSGGNAIMGYHGYQDGSIRIKALEEAVKVDAEIGGTSVLATARDFYAFLTGAA